MNYALSGRYESRNLLTQLNPITSTHKQHHQIALPCGGRVIDATTSAACPPLTHACFVALMGFGCETYDVLGLLYLVVKAAACNSKRHNRRSLSSVP